TNTPKEVKKLPMYLISISYIARIDTFELPPKSLYDLVGMFISDDNVVGLHI
ncbi:hypothetical protein LCGC14_2900310, partial [marine sediment metagenome]